MLAHRYACYYSPDEEVDTPKRFDNMEFVQNEELWLDEVSQLMSCGNYGGDIAYDENGNAIIVQDIRFKWSAGRILDGVDCLDTDGSILISESFTYDEKGIRTSKTVNGKTTYYTTVDGTITSQYELDEQGEVINEMVFLYDSNGNLIGFTYGDNTYFYIKNHMNDVMGIADAGGTWLVSYTYDAYGTVHWQYETNSEVQTDIDLTELAELNPMLYRSYYCDREAGVYYLQSRYYLPDFGRFFNADLPEYAKLQKDDYAGINLFAYCNNDPVNGSDPDGYFTKEFHKSNTYTIAWVIINNKLKKSFKYSKYKDKNKLNKLANKMAQGAYDVDVKYPSTKKFYSKYNQSFHFNVNSTKPKMEDSRMTRYYELRKKAIDKLASAKQKYSKNKNACFDLLCEAFYLFGMSLHPRQDMIAHSGKGGNLFYSNSITDSNGRLIPLFYYHLPGYDNPNWKYKNTNSTKSQVFYKNTTDLIESFIKIVISKGF